MWLQLRSAGRQQEYLVMSAAGNLEGRVSFPAGAVVEAADDRVIWVVQANEFDVPSIVKYQLTKP